MPPSTVLLLDKKSVPAVAATNAVPDFLKMLPSVAPDKSAPVPPLLSAIAVALHVPVVIVPRVVIEVWPTYDAWMLSWFDPLVLMVEPSTLALRVVPEKLNPVPAVIAPDDENKVKVSDVVPRVIGLAVVST